MFDFDISDANYIPLLIDKTKSTGVSKVCLIVIIGQ